MIAVPESLLEAVRYFSDLKICNAYMRQIKWPNGEMRSPCPSGNCTGSPAQIQALMKQTANEDGHGVAISIDIVQAAYILCQ